MKRLRLTEIFFSLQGETRTVGIPTVFIRLTGCPLRCGYCDTSYAFQGGTWHDFDHIFAQIKQYQTRFVTVTGGEPLAQKSCPEFLFALCEAGYQVSLETSGALNVAFVDKRVVKVMDLKTPSSGEVSKNLWENLDHLQSHDQIKFVIGDHADYEWSKTILDRHKLADQCEVLFSPVYQALSIEDLAGWVLKDQLPVRVQVQLHKIIWGDVPGR